MATWLANALIVSRFPDAVRPDDLLFELLPYVGPARWLTVVALFAGIGAFLWVTIRPAPSTLPVVGAAVALLYLLRAMMMVLTPLAPAQGDGYFVFPQVQYGMFPSGHTALLTLLALLVPAEQRRHRRFQWSMVAVMIAGLLLAHGHYSIDVVGGLLLAHFVATMSRRGKLLPTVRPAVG